MESTNSASEVFADVKACVGKAEYTVLEEVPNEKIRAEGGRDFSWIVMALLILFLWPAALVYYFTRQRSGISATITKNDDGGCTLNINSNGKSGEIIIETLEDRYEETQK